MLNVIANLRASGSIVVDKTHNVVHSFQLLRDQLLEVRNDAQCREQLDGHREVSSALAVVGYELSESWIGVVESVTEQYVHHNVPRTGCHQLFHVKRTTVHLSHFVYQLFHFNQDPCLHHPPTKSELFQDGKT